MSGGLALVRTFSQWKIEHQVRKCCLKGLILRTMAGHERDAGRLYDNVQSSTDKKLATTKDRQTLQNSDEKQYCQYWMLSLFVAN